MATKAPCTEPAVRQLEDGRVEVPITQKVCDQACRYNTVLHVPLQLLTNGAQQVVLEVDFERRAIRQLQQLPHFIVK